MSKSEHVKWVFDSFNGIMTDMFERLKMKYVFIKIINDRACTASVDVEGVLHIELSAEEMKAKQEQMHTELRRIFIGDLYSNCDQFCVYLDNVLKERRSEKGRHWPGMFKEVTNQPLGRLNRYLTRPEKDFLSFLHLVRNSMVHYDGNYNASSEIDYEFSGLTFKTTPENLGTQIIWSDKALIDLWERCKSIFDYEKFNRHPLFPKELEPKGS